MLIARSLPLVLALAMGTASPAHDGGEGPLTAPEGSPQPAASGEIEVRSSPTGGSLAVEVRNADPAVELTAFLDDGTGTFASIGVLVAEDGGLAMEIDTAAGGILPHGVASVDLLAGLAIEIRDGASAVVLAGTVPAPGTGDGDDDDGDDDGDHGRPTRGCAALVRADTSPFPDARGRVEVEVEGGEEEFEIEANRLDPGTGVEFLLEDGGGTMASIGTGVADGKGEVEIEFETEEGGALPLGAASVSELAGRRVEIRAGDGTPVLLGEVPEATTEALKLRGREDAEDDDSDARVRVTMLVDNRSGRERLDLELKAVAPGTAGAEVFIEDDGGTMAPAADVPLRRSGRGRARYDTRKGDPLPLGVASVRDLAGRAFEIRVEGAVVVSGNFPSL